MGCLTGRKYAKDFMLTDTKTASRVHIGDLAYMAVLNVRNLREKPCLCSGSKMWLSHENKKKPVLGLYVEIVLNT